ncbi:hypothetical protein Cob_v003801 [Colletotrichum orbiculare MAFF 240422]|uniref:Uncharacterized protein n=1 Tax=Colletotrichum orbiculare (strain 104-T / ATCC 96160 / CBS 514.97 / LARS 414 / MAFF 240422) TaxID=1213857 RepID=A0A484FZ48_COLOR|nr:hypothetical protein Cob_v003801 [Colletotrichum orbiculare MAFF 240422]
MKDGNKGQAELAGHRLALLDRPIFLSRAHIYTHAGKHRKQHRQHRQHRIAAPYSTSQHSTEQQAEVQKY